MFSTGPNRFVHTVLIKAPSLSYPDTDQPRVSTILCQLSTANSALYPPSQTLGLMHTTILSHSSALWPPNSYRFSLFLPTPYNMALFRSVLVILFLSLIGQFSCVGQQQQLESCSCTANGSFHPMGEPTGTDLICISFLFPIQTEILARQFVCLLYASLWFLAWRI